MPIRTAPAVLSLHQEKALSESSIRYDGDDFIEVTTPAPTPTTAHAFTSTPCQQHTDENGSSSIPRASQTQAIYVSSEINGRTCSLLVDTGATHSILSRQFASRIGILASISPPPTGPDITLADGSSTRSYGTSTLEIQLENNTKLVNTCHTS
jgi:predicted aspartyl protease